MSTLKDDAPARRNRLSAFIVSALGALPIALAAITLSLPADAATLTPLYNFGSETNDGCDGSSSLVFGGDNTLYGETYQGGSQNLGTVFSFTKGYAFDTVLHSFDGYNVDHHSGGSAPQGSLIYDSAGNLYGTTYAGGKYGAGTVFKIALDGTLTTLYNFTGGSDGGNPVAGLVADGNGNLYGTTANGGVVYNEYGWYGGTLFKLAPATGTLTTLHRFIGDNIASGQFDGADPHSDLIFDAAGNLYGTTVSTVFEYTTGGQLRTLYAFGNSAPQAGLVFDHAGNLYGTTSSLNQYSLQATVFRLTPSTGALVTLHTFGAGADGGDPQADLIFDSAGNLYGTTTGVVFRLGPASNGQLSAYEVLATLPYPAAGYVNGALVLDSAGTLYGTSSAGGTHGCGLLYSIAGVAAPGPTLTPSEKSLSFKVFSFGGTTIGNTRTVTISVKKGSGNYIPNTPLLTGPSASEFSITANSCTGVIAAGSSCAITVLYTRQGTSSLNSIASLNLTGDATLSIGLSGKPPGLNLPL